MKEWISSTEYAPWQAGNSFASVAGDTLSFGETAQTVRGFGGCFNELGMIALRQLSDEERALVFDELFSPDKCNDCRNQQELTELWHNYGGGQIRVDASIHGEYTSGAPLWRWMADYAKEHGLRMHVHASETVSEHEASIARNGKTPFRL